MKILVTGGAGYIGSHTCKALAASGYEPVTYDNLSRGHEWAVKWGPFVKGDIHDKELLKETIKKYKIDSIIHFAAFAYVGESCERPDLYYQNNVEGSINLFEAAKECNVKNIVFSSTCSVYGNGQRGSFKEEHPVNPINPYANSKYMVEQILRDYANKFKFNYAILRYFNAAGADIDGEIGEAHDPEPHIIPIALDAALNPLRVLKVFGQDYDTRDGTCVRDYIHVCDLADAHIRSLEKINSQNTALLLNLGSARGHTILELLHVIEKVTGLSVPYEIGARREGDPASLVATITRAKAELGWELKYSDLETIVSSAFNWMKSQRNE